MSPPEWWAVAAAWLGTVPTHTKVLLALATGVMLVELGFRHLAPRSAAYARWTRMFQAVGRFWTAMILSLVYFISVAGVSAFMKALGKDLLDRRLAPEPSFWRPHQPNPLGPEAAARHQF